MDSGNSGSLQSSSGGGGAGDEYDSPSGSVTGAAATGADSFNSLLHSGSSVAAAAASPFFFDTLSYLDNFSRPPPPPPPQPPPSLAPSSSRSFRQSPAELIYTSSITAAAPSTAAQSMSRESQQAETAPPRGSKKRTRASRRAPTTVLTTDTSNFRAMVQEFTGIPSPPFSSTAPVAGGHSSFPRSRLDLFNSSGAAAASAPPYLLRPFPQRQAFNNSSINTTPLSISTSSSNFQDANARAQQNPSNDNNYQLSSDLIAMQTQNPSNNIMNTSFQSLLQSMPPSQLAGYSSEQLHVPSTSAEHFQLLRELPSGSSGGVTRWPGSEDGGRSRLPQAVRVPEKRSDGGAAAAQARSEGMVESWICSSD